MKTIVKYKNEKYADISTEEALYNSVAMQKFARAVSKRGREIGAHYAEAVIDLDCPLCNWETPEIKRVPVIVHCEIPTICIAGLWVDYDKMPWEVEQ